MHILRAGSRSEEGTLVFLHATGLNASAYRPLLSRLRFGGEVLVPSLRGHGATTLPADPSKLTSWQVLADDVVGMLLAEDFASPLVLAGHSAGAVTALLAARRLPAAAVLMIEPVVLPRWIAVAAASPLRRAFVNRIQVAKQAAARRQDFPSREAARNYYKPKAFFRNWDEEALDGYLAEGLRDIEGGAELTCAPAWEAAMFRAQAHGFWPHLSEVIAQGKHVAILGSQGRTTFPVKVRPKAAAFGARLREEEGGHMLPLENPDTVADWMSYEIKGEAPPTRV
ncbi:alpha/beta hydrolase [Parvularcula maris]|nr:alpha/beta hydrolase [Parvularcula maris]